MSEEIAKWKAAVDGAGVVGAVVLTGAAYLLGYAPLAEDARRASELRQGVREARASLDSASARMEAARARLESLRAEEASSIEMLPVTALNRRLGTLAERAEAAGLRITSTRPGEPRALARYTAVPLSLGGDCSYPGFVKFLELLHAEVPDVAVESFELSALRGSGGADGAVFSVRAAWHARKDQADGAGAGSPTPNPGG
ncbi:MAG: GspMb/PilO family protein [Phycisphaerales bacterium]